MKIRHISCYTLFPRSCCNLHQNYGKQQLIVWRNAAHVLNSGRRDDESYLSITWRGFFCICQRWLIQSRNNLFSLTQIIIRVFLIFVLIQIRPLPSYIANHFNIIPISLELLQVIPGFSVTTYVFLNCFPRIQVYSSTASLEYKSARTRS